MRPVRGFTLLELAVVLAMMGTLVAIAAPSYELYLQRSRAAEARLTLPAIAHAELAYRRDHGRYVACAPSPATPPRSAPRPFDPSAAGWRELGLRLEGPVRYTYEVKVAGDGYEAIAVGDLDGDGRTSRFALPGSTLELAVTDELE